MINKDTKIYGSFSENPGNNGCTFFNSKFKEHNINAIYKSFYSNDIQKSVESAKNLGFSGFAVSAPHKIKLMEYLDEYDTSTNDIGASNTVVIKDGVLYGYNTDWVGVYRFFLNSGIEHINIIGYGGFGKAVAYALNKLNITFSLLLRQDVKNIDDVSGQYFINATPSEFVSDKNKIIDARPFTDDGRIIADLQAREQFNLYTGIKLI
jgi:shikimate 5-dehydrogenase